MTKHDTKRQPVLVVVLADFSWRFQVADESLGLDSTCSRCGGENKKTGREQLRTDRQQPIGVREPERTRYAEIRCSQCGQLGWTPIGDA
jgi:uncharacterized protein with PIN domain